MTTNNGENGSQGAGSEPLILPPMRSFQFKWLDISRLNSPENPWVDMLINAHSTQVTDGGVLEFFEYSINPQGMYLRHAFNNDEWRSLREIVDPSPTTIVGNKITIN